MKHIRLVHWNKVEAKDRAARLKGAGYSVDFEQLNPESFRRLKASPPAAIVIDLSRRPSQGRDVAVAIRLSGGTRHIPLVFVAGEPGKVADIRKLLPDAAYTSWNKIRGSLKRAVAHPPARPVVPESAFAGYSGTSLSKKLGIRASSAVLLVNAPRDFEKTLGKLPEGVRLRRRAGTKADLIIWFTESQSTVERGLGRMVGLAEQAGLWIVWPKKGSGIGSDLSQAVVRKLGLSAGLVDYKICAIDETWSGLLFTVRKSK
jgi:CheY-like chemotaxis protein